MKTELVADSIFVTNFTDSRAFNYDLEDSKAGSSHTGESVIEFTTRDGHVAFVEMGAVLSLVSILSVK